MRCLFIDTSSFFINIAITYNNTIIYHKYTKIERDMSSLIIPIIKEGFDSVSFDIKNLDKIFIVNGPGSFTGVRVGVTVAKTIAWSLNIPLIPISSLEVIASTNSGKKYHVGLIDARRGNVFAGVYDKKLNVIKEDRFIHFNELDINDDYELIGEGYKESNPDILKVINKHINDEDINPHVLKPNYLKLTEAEEKLNDKRNN